MQFLKKPVYHRGTVTCRKCGTAIFVYRVTAVRDEFSVRCLRCGDRGVYLKREMTIQELPERRRKPRRDSATAKRRPA